MLLLLALFFSPQAKDEEVAALRDALRELRERHGRALGAAAAAASPSGKAARPVVAPAAARGQYEDALAARSPPGVAVLAAW
jgi:hypothetical protein